MNHAGSHDSTRRRSATCAERCELLGAEERSGRHMGRSRRKVTLVISAWGCRVVAGYPLVLPVFPTNSISKAVEPNLYRCIARYNRRRFGVGNRSPMKPTTCPPLAAAPSSSERSALCPFIPLIIYPSAIVGCKSRAPNTAPTLPSCKNACATCRSTSALDRKAFSRKYWHKSRLLRQLRLSAPDEDLGIAKGAVPVLQRPPPESVVMKTRASSCSICAVRLVSRRRHGNTT